MSAATTALNDGDAFAASYALVAGADLAERCSIITAGLPAYADQELGTAEVQRQLLARFAGAGSDWSKLTRELDQRFDRLGVVLVRGLRFDPGNRLLIALLASLGTVAGDANPGRQVVHNLRPIARPPDKPDFELDFHTGSYFRARPHEVLALLCIQPGLQGGASRLVRLDDLLDTMRRQGQADAVELLTRRAVRFKRPRRIGGGYLERPLLSPIGDSGALQVRFERRRVLSRAPGRSTGYGPALLAAIAAFEAAANAPGTCLEYPLQADELLIIDNRRVLHARRAVPGGSASGRHLKRVKGYRP